MSERIEQCKAEAKECERLAMLQNAPRSDRLASGFHSECFFDISPGGELGHPERW